MKKMTKRLKTLLALGVVTVSTASTIVPVNALSKDTLKDTSVKGAICIYINGFKCNLPLYNGCPNQPIKPNCPVEKPISPEIKPDTPVEKPVVPEVKPDTPVQKPVVPEVKPDTPVQKPVAPEVKPDTPVQKPVVPEVKPDAPVEKPVVPEVKPDAPTTGNFSAYQKEVVDLVNVERTKRGLKALQLDSSLSNVATTKSQDMINKNYFDHNSPTYGSPFDMMKHFGINYKSAGENIAMGQKTPSEVVNSWMNSKGHRENILNSSFTNIGVGIAKNSNGSTYWTQMFVGR